MKYFLRTKSLLVVIFFIFITFPANAISNLIVIETEDYDTHCGDPYDPVPISDPQDLCMERNSKLWQLIDDPEALGGSCMATPEGSGDDLIGTTENYLSYSFIAPGNGEHSIWIHASGPNSQSDSFWVSIDSGELLLLDQLEEGWKWYKVAGAELTNGSVHTLNIHLREDGSRVDQIIVSSSPDYHPRDSLQTDQPTNRACPVNYQINNEEENVSLAVTGGPSGPGIAITFDDKSIDSWYNIRELLLKYNASATFFVSGFNTLSATDIRKLQDLKEDGNEIGFHGCNHINAVSYLEKGFTLTDYLNEEIYPCVNSMREEGLFPTSFAYPFGARSHALDSVLLNIFDFIRGTAYSLEEKSVKDVDRAFYSTNSSPLLHGIGIDNAYNNPLDEIKEGMDRARKEQEILVFYAHNPINKDYNLCLPLDKLEGILQYAEQLGLDFYTISELRSWEVSWNGTEPSQVLNYSRYELPQLGFGDFDGTGSTDIIFSTGNEWRISRNGSNEWELLNTLDESVSELGFGDFDGDGTTDILMTTGKAWFVSWSGSSPWRYLNTSSYLQADLEFGDFDGNGTTDIFVTTGKDWYVSWDGSSRWQRLKASPFELDALGFGDFDGDGTTDILMTTGKAWFVSWGGASIWRYLNTSNYSLTDLGFGDFDGNGTTDIFITTGKDWYVSWDGSSRWQRLKASPFELDALGFGDFNGDGAIDVLSSSHSSF